MTVGFTPFDPSSIGQPEVEEPGLGEVTFGALVVGAGKDPFVRLAFDALDDLIPQLSPESLSHLERTISSSSVADVFKFVGEFGAMVGPGLGTFAAGRAGARALIKASSSVALKDARDFLLHEAGTAAAARFATTPLALRAGEIVGGSVGFGVEGFARGKAEGKETGEALQQGAEQFLLSLGLEGGLVALSRTPALQRLVGARGASATAKGIEERQVESALQETVWKRVGEMAAESPEGKTVSSMWDAFENLPKAEMERLTGASRRAAALKGEFGPAAADSLGQFRAAADRLERDVMLAEKKAGVKVLETTQEANLRYYESTVASGLAKPLLEDSLSPLDKLLAESTLEKLGGFKPGKLSNLPKPPKNPLDWAKPPKNPKVIAKLTAKYEQRLASYEQRLEKAKDLRLKRIARTDKKLRRKAVAAQGEQQQAVQNLTQYEEELFKIRGGVRPVARLEGSEFVVEGQRVVGLKELATREELVPFYTRYMDDLGRFSEREGTGLTNRFLRTVGWGGSLTPREIGAWADDVAVKYLKSPETAMRELGLPMAFLADGAKVASIEARSGELAYRTHLVRRFQDLAKAMGKEGEFRGTGLRGQIEALFKGRDGNFARPVREVFEKRGIKGVEQEFTRPVAEAWQAIMNDLEVVSAQARALGGLPKMTQLQLSELGVQGYFPHIVTLPEGAAMARFRESLVQQALKRGQPLHHARSFADTAIAEIEKAAGGGLPKVGAIDKARQIPGTIDEIAAALEAGEVKAIEQLGGVIETDPFKALDTLYSQLSYRVAFGKQFGLDGRMADALAEVAVQGGAPAGRVRTLVDAVAKGERYGTASHQRIARIAVNMQIMSKLGLAVIPNLTQPVNAIAAFDIQNFAKGVGKMLKPDSPERLLVLRAHGAIDAGMQSTGKAILEDVQAVSGIYQGAPLDNAARAFMGITGFSLSESFNRTLSGVVGLELVQSTMAKHAAGKLVGRAAAKARRQFQGLGLDLDEVVRKGWYRDNPVAQQQMLERVAYEAGRTTQFIQDITRTPLYWHTPFGRVMFQFKTFAFNQGKFVRDNVLKEAVEGNLQPLATLLTVYPAAGHLVNQAVDLFREHPKRYNGLEAYVRDLAAVGGFGMMYSIVNSLSYRQGLDQLVGPTVSDVGRTLEALVTDDPLGELWDRQMKQPTFRLGRSLGLGGAELLGAGLEAASEAFGPSEEADRYSRILDKGK